MSHSITISGNTVEEFHSAFGQFAKTFGFVKIADLQAAARAANTAEMKKPAEQTTAEVPKPRGRAKAKIEPEADKFPKSDDLDAPAKNDIVATLDDAKAALREVAAEVNKTACEEVLGEFKAKRVSDVPEAEFGAFIAACKKKVAGK
jgi:hypothetical protein